MLYHKTEKQQAVLSNTNLAMYMTDKHRNLEHKWFKNLSNWLNFSVVGLLINYLLEYKSSSWYLFLSWWLMSVIMIWILQS